VYIHGTDEQGGYQSKQGGYQSQFGDAGRNVHPGCEADEEDGHADVEMMSPGCYG
jgi:hypothetical protein